MLTRDQFARHGESRDQFGRSLGTGPSAQSMRIDALGRVMRHSRPGHEAAQALDEHVNTAHAARRDAPDDATATEADRAWTDLKAAQTHLLLIAKFEQLAADWRADANRFAAAPGGMMRAEQARVQAAYYSAVAQRHRDEAEARQEKGMVATAEVVQMIARARAAHQQPAAQSPAPPGPRIARRPAAAPAQAAPPTGEPPPNPLTHAPGGDQ